MASSQTRAGDTVYTHLWKLCAGPLVDIPLDEEKAFYFPQGHMEQLQASTNQELNDELNQQIPHFNLPSKILCRIVDTQLLAEHDTDEVYARITLLPVSDENDPIIAALDPPEAKKKEFYAFSKILTASDTSTHGGFSVPRKHAIECLPPLDMTQETPTQELVVKDLHGYEWKFKHIFRGHPKRHLITTGWSNFVTSKRLIAGDVFVFVRGENDELRIGIRRLSQHQSPIPSSVISSQSMILGVLATATHALLTNTMFAVYYKPRTSQFIIGLNKYLEAVNQFSVGMRFKTRFEVEGSPQKSLSGTVVGVGDASPEWENSQWRSLKVQWDEQATISMPERVSPWEIKPFEATTASNVTQPVANGKRSRPAEASSSDVEIALDSPASALRFQGPSLSLEPTHLGGTAEIQNIGTPDLWSLRQQEISGNPVNADWLPSPYLNVSSNFIPRPKNDKDIAVGLSISGYPPVSSRPNDGLAHDQMESGKKIENPPSFRLFGVNLTKNIPSVALPEKELGSAAIIPSGPKDSIHVASCETEDGQNLNYLLSNKEQKQIISDASLNERQNKQVFVSATRTRTKVQMQGVAVGRAVDLAMLNDYSDLTDELEKMFDIKGELRMHDKWTITFTDDDNDVMLVGDHSWQEFCSMVKRIVIYSSEDVKNMKCKRPASSSEVEEILLCQGSHNRDLIHSTNLSML